MGKTLTETAIDYVAKEAGKIEARAATIEAKRDEKTEAIQAKALERCVEIEKDAKAKIKALSADLKADEYFKYVADNCPEYIPESLR